jgi:hypothetical protein
MCVCPRRFLRSDDLILFQGDDAKRRSRRGAEHARIDGGARRRHVVQFDVRGATGSLRPGLTNFVTERVRGAAHDCRQGAGITAMESRVRVPPVPEVPAPGDRGGRDQIRRRGGADSAGPSSSGQFHVARVLSARA